MKISIKKLVVNWLVKNEAVRAEDRELYEYAVSSLFLLISPFFLALILGLLIGIGLKGIIIVLPFTLIRRYSGGAHASRLWICLTESTLVMTVSFIISKYIGIDTKTVVVLVIGIVSLIVFSPIDNENKRLSSYEKIRNKRIVIYQILVEVVLISAFYLLNLKNISLCLMVGIMIAAVLQYQYFLTKIWQNVVLSKKNVDSRIE